MQKAKLLRDRGWLLFIWYLLWKVRVWWGFDTFSSSCFAHLHHWKYYQHFCTTERIGDNGCLQLFVLVFVVMVGSFAIFKILTKRNYEFFTFSVLRNTTSGRCWSLNFFVLSLLVNFPSCKIWSKIWDDEIEKLFLSNFASVSFSPDVIQDMIHGKKSWVENFFFFSSLLGSFPSSNKWTLSSSLWKEQINK